MFIPKLYDLIQQPNNFVMDKVLEELDFIATQSFPLVRNYSISNMTEVIKEFFSFTVIMDENTVIAFSGLQFGRWQYDLVRCSSRLWVNPKYRGKNIPSTWNSSMMMPHQLKIAEELNYIGACFWSREDPHNKNFDHMVTRNNENCPYGYEHVALDNVYNICRLINNKINCDVPCWQKIALITFNTDFKLELAKISFNEWKNKYGI